MPIERIAARADASRLAIGTGRDAPDPRDARLERFPTSTVEALAAEPGEGDSGVEFPADWEAQVLAWPRPQPEDLFEVIFTSGTTGNPKGVMLTHRPICETVGAIHHVIPPQEHRLVSLLPLSHLMEQVAALFYALTVGGDILYVRSRNPRVIFEAIRDHRVTTMLVVPQVLDLFWSAVEREVEAQGRSANFNRLRSIARHLPYRARRLIFRRVHQRLGGGLNLLVCAAAFLPPQLQQAWEDMGVVVMQGYGATECGMASVTTKEGPRPGDGRADDPADRGPARRATARSRSAARPSSRATGRIPKRPPRRSRPTAGTGPATSAATTTRDT